MKNNKKQQTGSAIIEVLMATAIIGVVVTAIATTLSFSMHNSSQARYRDIATSFGQDLIEIMRKERKFVGWGEFYSAFSDNQTYCVKESKLTLAEIKDILNSCNFLDSAHKTTIAKTDFVREMTVRKPAGQPDRLDIEIEVKWKSGTREHKVSMSQRFKNN